MSLSHFRALLLVLAAAQSVLGWTCIPIQSKMLREGVEWRTQNCTKIDLTDELPLLVVNSIHVDLTRSDIRVVPAVADPIAQVQSLPAMASQNDNFIAGINGGYFWRVDIEGFWRDNVCRGKVRKEAEQDASPRHPNFGIGDGVIKIDGKLMASNCNCSGYSRPAVLKLDGPESDIEVLHRGESVHESVQNAIAAGPNLVSYNAVTGESYVDIPEDDDNINRLVYEATTAVGLKFTKSEEGAKAGSLDARGSTTATELVMVTTDGSDSCRPSESFCGVEAVNLARLMKSIFESDVAMSMDQGGSTTMWVKGENPDREGVISNSDNKEPPSGTGRSLANGLFIEVL